jgi:hypothetical protein
MKSSHYRFIILCLWTFLDTGFAQAAENRWANARGDGSGKWETGANWSLGIPPNINHDVVIAAARSGTVSIDATTAGLPNNMVISSLRVGRPGSLSTDTDTLSLLNAGLTTPLTVLGSAVISNRGIVTITGSILDVGNDFTVNGSVRLNSGSILNAKDSLALNGGLQLDPGSILNAKNGLTMNGSMTLNGGLLIFTNAGYMLVGDHGQGSLNILAGELRVSGGTILHIGVQAGSVGTLTIAGGIGKYESLSSFVVGLEPGSTGSVMVAGGELITSGGFISGSGVGRWTISNGIWRANTLNPVVIGPRGILALAGGTSIVSSGLHVGTSLNTNSESSLLMTGGALFTTNAFVEIVSFAAISNGVWRARDVSVFDNHLDSSGAGRAVFAGGTTTISSNLLIGRCAQFPGGRTGLVTVAGGQLIVTNAATNAMLRIENGVFRLEGGTVVADTIALTNPCARFERTGGTLIYRTALLDPLRDDDGDGAPNGLEQSKGSDPLDPADRQRDNDGDGASDVHELLAGTDRFNSNSVVKIISILPQGEDVRVRWKTVAGKTNIVQAAQSLGGSNIFEDLATLVLPGTGERTNTFIEAEGAINGPSRLYRVKVIP